MNRTCILVCLFIPLLRVSAVIFTHLQGVPIVFTNTSTYYILLMVASLTSIMLSHCYLLFVFCSLLCCNHSFYVFIIRFIFFFFYFMFCFPFGCSGFLYSFVYCFSSFVQSTLFYFVYKFTEHYQQVEAQIELINIISYQHYMTMMW